MKQIIKLQINRVISEIEAGFVSLKILAQSFMVSSIMLVLTNLNNYYFSFSPFYYFLWHGILDSFIL
jgi:hypothetical protein